jgi:myo-inositol catabolism protein IolH
MFGAVDLETAIGEISRVGYEEVEISLGSRAFAAGATDAEIDEVGRVLRRHGVRPAAVFGAAFMASPDEATRRRGIETFRGQIHVAERLGCDLVTTEMSGGTSLQVEACSAAFLTSMEEICPILERTGIRAAFMPHPGDFIEEHDPALDVLRRVDSPLIGYLYSTPHTFILGRDPAAIVETAGDMLMHIQIADTFRPERFVVAYAPKGYVNMLKLPEYAAMNAHLHLVPGLGEVDFAALFAALHRIGYRGAISAIPFGGRDAVDLAAAAYRAIERLKAAPA